MRFRFVHTADLHLDSPLAAVSLRDPALAARLGAATRTAFERIVALCLDEAADALLIAGDLFDGRIRSAKTAAYLVRGLERLGEGGVRTYLIYGNHDAEAGLTRHLSLPTSVHAFDGRGGTVRLEEHGVAIHGVSFRKREAPESLLPKFAAPVPGLFNIGMLHTSLGGAEGHDVYAPVSVAALVAHGFDYWALGHIHGRTVHSEAPWIVMPGMPQGRDIGEAGAKSVTLVTVEDGQARLEERQVGPVAFARRALAVATPDWEGLRAIMAEALPAARVPGADETVLRLRLTGETPLAFRIRRDREVLEAEAVEIAATAGGLSVDRVEVAVQPPRATAGPEADPLAEMAGLMTALAEDPGFLAEADVLLERLVAELPPELRDRYGATEDARAAARARLLAEGSADVLAALAGAADAPEEA